MNKPTTEQIEGMVMYSIHLYSTTLYNKVHKIEVNANVIAAFYGEGDWMFTTVSLPIPFDINTLDIYVDELILNIEKIIEENNL